MLSILLQSGLFIWFILSIFLVAVDDTLGMYLKILGEMTNYLMIFFILSNMLNQIKSALYFATGFLMLGWYLYYTPQDFINGGYGNVIHVVYCLVDIATIVYITTSLLWACYSSQQRLSIKTQVDNIIKHRFNIWSYPIL